MKKKIKTTSANDKPNRRDAGIILLYDEIDIRANNTNAKTEF
jgi:hypothetical protein